MSRLVFVKIKHDTKPQSFQHETQAGQWGRCSKKFNNFQKLNTILKINDLVVVKFFNDYANFNLLHINNFFRSGKYFFVFTILVFFSPLVLFTVGNDWGRFVYILYNFCLIFTFYCLYDDKKVFVKINELPKINNLNYKFKLFFTLSSDISCFIW